MHANAFAIRRDILRGKAVTFIARAIPAKIAGKIVTYCHDVTPPIPLEAANLVCAEVIMYVMRYRSVDWLPVSCLLALASCAHQDLTPTHHPNRALVAEARSLATSLEAGVWPGLATGNFRVLLVDGDTEELLCFANEPPSGFLRNSYDEKLGCSVATRSRVFDPTFLATFPLDDGISTIVIGTPEATGKSNEEWVVTVLHEHFHQLQFACPNYFQRTLDLGLSNGDQTGMWMLNYPFPYQDEDTADAARELGVSLAEALQADDRDLAESLAKFLTARRSFAATIGAADLRYFDFQAWQEGTARYVERKAAAAWTAHSATRSSENDRLISALNAVDIRQDGRVAFYELGAGEAALLDRVNPAWADGYCEGDLSLHSRFER
ncbi:hypothetical protein [Erythrobacter sp. JK5]|uniref:hypothetical protein n=1 Tax=Erythrobacter sp. JK5 TaxID=2829500 RepID=UPI001BAD04AF|nr:hypothetical protein [Erythrobacter sp. JK5]QUL36746.1 hypothetical protein KDC96_09985 [Erythrobacter sp. JK5]